MFSEDTIDELQNLVYKLEKENEEICTKLQKIRKEVTDCLEQEYPVDCKYILSILGKE